MSHEAEQVKISEQEVTADGWAILVISCPKDQGFSQGTAVLDVRKGPGSARSGRASVSFDSTTGRGVLHGTVTLPVFAGESIRVFLEDAQGAPPILDFKLVRQ